MCEYIWPAIDEKLRKTRPKKGAKGIFLHFDNSPIHKSQKSKQKPDELGFTLLPHPAYSPDIAPSDFWLFEFIDRSRIALEAVDDNHLISQVQDVLEKIDKTVLGVVFNEWIRRLHMVIESGGEYIPNK